MEENHPLKKETESHQWYTVYLLEIRNAIKCMEIGAGTSGIVRVA